MEDFGAIMARVKEAEPKDNRAFSPEKTYGTHPKLLDNLRQAESGGNPYAINPKTGAMGPYQFMPDVVMEYRKKGMEFDPFNEHEARAAADYHYQTMLERAKGDHPKAVMLYGGFKRTDPTQYVNKVLEGVPTEKDQPQSGLEDFSAIMDRVKQAKTEQEVAKKPENVIDTAAGKVLQFGKDAAKAQADYLRMGAGAAAHALTGAAATVGAGIGGLYKLGEGHDLHSAVEASIPWQHQAMKNRTFQGEPGTPERAGSDVVDKIGEVINYPAHWADVKLHEAGHPIAGNLVQAGANLAGLLLPAKRLGVIEKAAPEAANYGTAGAASAKFSERAAAMGIDPITQAEIAAAEKAGQINPTAAERHLDALSLPEPVRLTEGQATGDIIHLSNEQNLRAKHPEYARRFNEQNRALGENFEHFHEQAAPDIYTTSAYENGKQLIEAYKTKDEALRADISAKYKALEDANGGQFPMPGKLFVETANAELHKHMKGEFLPSPVKSIMQNVVKKNHMTYEQFENLRTILAAEIRKSERHEDGNRTYALSIVRDTLEQMPISEATSEIKAIADTARSAAKARFDLLREDPAYKGAIDEKSLADDFVRKHIINGKVEHIETMRKNLEHDPLVSQAIASSVIHHLKERAGIHENGGNFSQAAYNKALRQIQPKLKHLLPPDMIEHVEKLGRVAQYVNEQPRGSFVNNSNTAVNMLAEHFQGAAEHMLNKATGGIAGALKERSRQKKINAQVENSLGPGAGVRLIDISRKQGLK